MTEVLNIGVRGYNSYIINKHIVIDTVPEKFLAEFSRNLPEKVDILIMTRTTPDASGCVKAMLLKNPKMQVYSTVAGLKNLKEITNTVFDEKLIKNEGFIDLGEDKLRFLITPNISWPDTAVAYLEKEKALFSGNLFCDSPEKDFFAKEFLQDAVKRILSLDINTIYSGYKAFEGTDMYDEFINSKALKEYAVIYASSSGQTKTLAERISKKLLEIGKKSQIFDCESEDKEEILGEINKACGIFIGTPTINHNAHKDVLDVISGINVIQNAGKPAFVFGTYGFSGEGTNIIAKLLGNLKIKVNKKPYRCIFNPSEKNLEDLEKEVLEFLEDVLDA